MHVAVAVVYMSVLCVPIPRKKEKGGIHTRKRVLTATASRETAFNKLSAVFCEPFFGTVSPSLSLVSVCLCNRREKKPSFLRRKNAPLSTPSDQHLFFFFFFLGLLQTDRHHRCMLQYLCAVSVVIRTRGGDFYFSSSSSCG